MVNNVYRFRRIKWGDPKKLRVLVEDFSPRKRPVAFILFVAGVSVLAFGIGFSL
ncbi:hypothetical protein [Mesorhizobium sp. NBSH29]|uniref:hypothetical protein n=1 Tax=Mesorhizobium sp. NBSH29 TaxID=2654249 RepID=UPI0018965D83|nr:hypothetical protein [Mesorhizobium sp. NBSH29]